MATQTGLKGGLALRSVTRLLQETTGRIGPFTPVSLERGGGRGLGPARTTVGTEQLKTVVVPELTQVVGTQSVCGRRQRTVGQIRLGEPERESEEEHELITFGRAVPGTLQGVAEPGPVQVTLEPYTVPQVIGIT